MLHITSLPSPYGVGTLGREAREFVDFLARSGQHYWQILPVGPTGFGDSPYQSFSTFAGNPYLIDLDDLREEGLLEKEEYAHIDWGEDPLQVDFGALYEGRFGVLRKACRRLLTSPSKEFKTFCRTHQAWLEDYALFMALKGAHNGSCWQDWEDPLRTRQPQALEEARRELAEEVDFWKGVQFLFFHQWEILHQAAAQKGVSILGDLPIYVAYDGADVWAEREQFQLDEEGWPIEVAGCPPDAFTADGQLWGNPLFDWAKMKRDGYDWWLRRIAHQFTLFDALRIDHFRGFEAYYAVPYGEETARNGRWRPGPGIELFKAVKKALGPRRIIAEDLGFLTEGVYKLLAATGYPGMRVMQFGFEGRDDSSYLPHNFVPNCVVYTGTHDNDTIRGWMDHTSPDNVAYAVDYLRLTKEEGYVWGMMRGAWSSVAELAIVTMQDLLELGSEARMNAPSTSGCNWKWRMPAGKLTPELAARLRHEMGLYRRLD